MENVLEMILFQVDITIELIVWMAMSGLRETKEGHEQICRVKPSFPVIVFCLVCLEKKSAFSVVVCHITTFCLPNQDVSLLFTCKSCLLTIFFHGRSSRQKRGQSYN